ncbi:MAG: hypothetical protein P8163_02670 [Candidatus Thiodiazotropha sp.]
MDCRYGYARYANAAATRLLQNGMATTSQGDITYYGDRAEGTININSQGMQMRSKTTGERLGPCTKK